MIEHGSQTAHPIGNISDAIPSYSEFKWKPQDLTLTGSETARLPDSLTQVDLDTFHAASDSEATKTNVIVSFSKEAGFNLSGYAALLECTADWSFLKPSTFCFHNAPHASTDIDNAMLVGETLQKVNSEIRALFSLATFLNLEPGMTNEFQKGLEQVIEKYGTAALAKIQDLILNRRNRLFNRLRSAQIRWKY